MKKIIIIMIAILTIVVVISGKLFYTHKIHAIANAASNEKISFLTIDKGIPDFSNNKGEQTFTPNIYKPAGNYISNVPKNLQNYYFSGRWYPYIFNGQQGMMTIQQGQEIYFKVIGTKKVTAFLQDTTGNNLIPPRISYQIDGGKWISVFPHPGYKGLDLADNLVKNKSHVIRIIVSSLFDNSFTKDLGCFFAGTAQDSGAKVTPVKPNIRTIYAIGDSIMAGRSDFVKEDKKSDTYGAGTIGGSRAEYGMISRTGEFLHARIIRNAFGGTGVVKKLNTANGIEAVDYIKKGVKDNYRYNPDLIVINYGINDYLVNVKDYSKTHKEISTKQFVNNYKILLNKLIEHFPGKPIFIIVPFGPAYLNELSNIANQYKNKNVNLINTDGWDITYSDNVHPDLNGAKVAGEKIADAIVAKLGMKYFGLK